MGTDIHMFLEVWCEDDEVWMLVRKLEINRDYILFGVLAGVREKSYQVFECKDMKGEFMKECSMGVREIHMVNNLWLDTNYFCASYITLLEFQDSLEKIRKKTNHTGFRVLESLEHQIIDYMKDMQEMTTHLCEDEIRVVFWFD